MKFVLEHSIHHSVGQIIDRSTDEETLSMAIRAIHNLCDCKEHVAVLGKNHIFPKLSNLLMKTENINLQKKLFATLSHIYNYMKRFSETSAHYWIGSEGGGKFIARYIGHKFSIKFSSNNFVCFLGSWKCGSAPLRLLRQKRPSCYTN